MVDVRWVNVYYLNITVLIVWCLFMISKKISWCDIWVLIVLFGVVSLFADVAYEGGRSILPSYMTKVLGAGILLLGVGIGFAEFLGLALRLAVGFIADITRGYWVLVFLGYGLVYAVPFLALVWNPYIALALFIVERFGKAIRAPARDALLSSIPNVGRGMVFGIHELLDQLGAVLGPGIASMMLLYYGNYRLAYMSLGISVTLALMALYVARTCWSKLGLHVPGINSSNKMFFVKNAINRELSLYLFFVFFAVAALVPYQIILYVAQGMVSDWLVPIVYLVAQGIDAGSALLAGYSFDRIGVLSITPAILATPLTALTLGYSYISSNTWIIIVSAIIYGFVIGYHESIFRAALANIALEEYRGTSYGLYYTSYGLGLIVAGYSVSVFYSNPIILTTYSSTLVLIAIMLLINIAQHRK